MPRTTAQVIARGLEVLAQEQGRYVSMAEALEMLFGQVLAKTEMDEKALAKVRSEAAKDQQAVQDRLRKMVEEAREFARQMGCHIPQKPARVSKAGETSTTVRPARVMPSESDATSESPKSKDLGEMMAANIVGCSTDEMVRIVERGQPVWRNKKLRFNPDARGLTPAQRKDLLRRDGYCCPVPGCPNRLWLQAHHLLWYSLGGETSAWNMLFLCPCCHKNHHEGLLRIIGCPEDGTLLFLDKYGQQLGVGSPLERAAWLDSWFGWAGESETDSRALTFILANRELAGDKDPSSCSSATSTLPLDEELEVGRPGLQGPEPGS